MDSQSLPQSVGDKGGGVQRVIIVGSGPAGLMAATQLKSADCEVVIVDQKTAPARKFLVAGDGGFNLTHSEPIETFVQKYNRDYVRNCVEQFTNDDFRNYLNSIGIETFIGSSGKLFPIEPTKPIEVLSAWKKNLKQATISWKLKTRLVDFDETSVALETAGTIEKLSFDYLIFALGGASWKKTGSDGHWLELFRSKGVPVVEFQASNSGVELEKSDWLKANEGQIIKNIRIKAGEQTTAGDLVVTNYGLEGKPIYAANAWLRENHFKGMTIDFKPQLSEDQVITTLLNAKNVRSGFEKLKLPGVVYNWLKAEVSKEVFTDALVLGRLVKEFEPKLVGLRPIDEVISTVGGVEMEAIDANGELKSHPNVFCAGEMLDWDAPTGGYLLQGCVSTGYVVGRFIRNQLID